MERGKSDSNHFPHWEAEAPERELDLPSCIYIQSNNVIDGTRIFNPDRAPVWSIDAIDKTCHLPVITKFHLLCLSPENPVHLSYLGPNFSFSRDQGSLISCDQFVLVFFSFEPDQAPGPSVGVCKWILQLTPDLNDKTPLPSIEASILKTSIYAKPKPSSCLTIAVSQNSCQDMASKMGLRPSSSGIS